MTVGLRANHVPACTGAASILFRQELATQLVRDLRGRVPVQQRWLAACLAMRRVILAVKLHA